MTFTVEVHYGITAQEAGMQSCFNMGCLSVNSGQSIIHWPVWQVSHVSGIPTYYILVKIVQLVCTEDLVQGRFTTTVKLLWAGLCFYFINVHKWNTRSKVSKNLNFRQLLNWLQTQKTNPASVVLVNLQLRYAKVLSLLVSVTLLSIQVRLQWSICMIMLKNKFEKSDQCAIWKMTCYPW